ncbi:Serine/threonine-protein kinase, partial [Coemansia sp. RSA 1821]
MLESDQDSRLRSRLELSVNPDTLDSKHELQVKPLPQTRSRKRTLRHMLHSHSLRHRSGSEYKYNNPSSSSNSNNQDQRSQPIADLREPFRIQQLKLPSPITSLNASDIINSCNSLESNDDKVLANIVLDNANTKPESSEQKPQRENSLMFKPLLDVTAVGSVFDIDQNEPAKPPKGPRILSSIRRVARTHALAIQKYRHRAMKSWDVCPIDTEQDDVQPGFQAAMPAMKPQQDHTTAGSKHQAIAMSLAGAKQFLLNTPLGEFEVERTLGQGSYGKVKLMRSALTGEQFAVKIIRRLRVRTDPRKAKTLDRRVVREANLAAILDQLHPHIVPLHDLQATDTHFYLLYAFVEDPTLAERVRAHGIDEVVIKDAWAHYNADEDYMRNEIGLLRTVHETLKDRQLDFIYPKLEVGGTVKLNGATDDTTAAILNTLD